MIYTFLITVGTICAFTTILAVIMVISEATIGNYGRIKITLNGKKELEADGGISVLMALKNEGVFIPSACGGRGSCGLCKIKLAEKSGDPAPTEMTWLTKDEINKNVRLSCQMKLKKPLSIIIPEELLSVRQYKTKVASIRDLTHDIKEVRLKLIDPPRMDFIAGQFIQFEVPPYKFSDEPVYRAYSISSPPSDAGFIELEIRLVPNGICTTYVHRFLKTGDMVNINGPYGDFRLSNTKREAIMIAGGSGMAPIKAILQDMADRGDTRKTRYYFGAKTKADLFLLDEMKRLESVLADFKFIPTLSRPTENENWDGERGLITQTIEKYVENNSEAEAYLCGSPQMIEACVKVLNAKGITNDRIFYDKFA